MIFKLFLYFVLVFFGSINCDFIAEEIVVVTATRITETLINIPATVKSFTSDEIKFDKAAYSLPSLVAEVEGVLGQRTANGQGSPYLRGFTGFHTLLLIDGIRLNNSVFRSGPNQYWATVDPYSASKVEVVKSPSSVLWGSDAIGGVVNVITPSSFELQREVGWHVDIYYRGSTAQRGNTGRLLFVANTGIVGGWVGVTLFDFGDTMGGSSVGKMPKTGYGGYFIEGRIDTDLEKDTILTLGYNYAMLDDIWRTHKTIYGIKWKGTSAGSDLKHVFDQERDLVYLKYKQGNYESFFFDTLDFTLSYHSQEEECDRVKKDLTESIQGFDVNTFGTSLQFLREGIWHKTIYGLDYYCDYVDSFNLKFDSEGNFKGYGVQGPVADNSTYQMLGIYLQEELMIIEKNRIIPAVRCEWVKANAGKFQDPLTGETESFKDSWRCIVGSIKSKQIINSVVTLFGGISQGFRAPNLSDLTRFDVARTGEIETPSVDLESEKFIQYEFGIRFNNNTLSSSLSCYYTDIQNIIDRVPTGRIIEDMVEVTKRNTGDGYIYGGEANFIIHFLDVFDFLDRVDVFGNIGAMNGKVETYPTEEPVKKKEYISRLAPPAATVGIKLGFLDNLDFIFELKGALKADKLSSRDKMDTERIPPGGTPGYLIGNFRTVYKKKDFMLSAAVENITDEDYRIHGSGINEPGRNFVISIGKMF